MMLILTAAALAAATPPDAAANCPDDGSPAAFSCLALARNKEGRPAEAAEAFERLAAALPAGDPQKDRALAAAGNMWIAANQPGKAAVAIDRALAGTGLLADQRGQALLDRARAAEAQNDLKTARSKVAEAAKTISQDPFLWYFSAALAIREGNAALARQEISKALALAPNDPLILFEAGHAAHFAGDLAAARDYWTRAAAADPNGRSGTAAKQALALLDDPVKVQSRQQPTK